MNFLTEKEWHDERSDALELYDALKAAEYLGDADGSAVVDDLIAMIEANEGRIVVVE